MPVHAAGHACLGQFVDTSHIYWSSQERDKQKHILILSEAGDQTSKQICVGCRVLF